MDMRRCIAIITNLDIAIKLSILAKDVISLSILKMHRICAFWKKLNYFSEGPYVLGSKKNTLFSIAGNTIFHLDISQSDKYQIFEKLYQTVDLSRIRKLDFNECLYSAIYKIKDVLTVNKERSEKVSKSKPDPTLSRLWYKNILYSVSANNKTAPV